MAFLCHAAALNFSKPIMHIPIYHMMNHSTNHSTSTIPPLSNLIIHRTRVRDVDGFIGTIRYIGPVASAKDPSEVYLGVRLYM